MKRLVLAYLCAVLVAAAWPQRENPAVAEMIAGARNLLGSMTARQQSAAAFSVEDAERLNWHYVPRPRKGVALKELTPAQHKLAHALLATGLSREGYVKAANIMYLEQILHEQEDNSPIRDPDDYSFTIFGKPSETEPWGWRVEGHHLSLNFTLRGPMVLSATPAFFGANPARVKNGPLAGLQVLEAEEDLGRRLVLSFRGARAKEVIIDVKAPADILTRASRKAELGSPVGVPVSEMDKEQAAMLMNLVNVYAHRLREELAESELEKLRGAGLEKIRFAWAGGLEPGQPHYYRIQGPTFVIEFDNTQNNANHIHSVWRDFEGDFGMDALRDHYAQSHRGALAK